MNENENNTQHELTLADRLTLAANARWDAIKAQVGEWAETETKKAEEAMVAYAEQMTASDFAECGADFNFTVYLEQRGSVSEDRLLLYRFLVHVQLKSARKCLLWKSLACHVTRFSLMSLKKDCSMSWTMLLRQDLEIPARQLIGVTLLRIQRSFMQSRLQFNLKAN